MSSYLLTGSVNFSVGLLYVDNSMSKLKQFVSTFPVVFLLACSDCDFLYSVYVFIRNKSYKSGHPHKVPKHRRGASASVNYDVNYSYGFKR